MTKKTLSRAIPSTWMRGQALLEPWAGPGGLAPRKAEREKGLEGGQGQRVDVRVVHWRRSKEQDTSDTGTE